MAEMQIQKNASKRSLENVHCTAKTMMAMFIVSFLTICCTEENITNHPTAATDIMVDTTMASGYGWAQTDLEASAKDADGNVLTAVGNLRYAGLLKVYVEQLGMPVTLVGEPVCNLDGSMDFRMADGNNFHRTINVETKGVNVTVTASFAGGYLGERLNDSTEVAYATFADEADVFASSLPEGMQRRWQGVVKSVVPYLRVVRQEAPAPEPDVITWQLRAEMDEVVDGEAYYTIWAEKLVNGEVAKTWSTYVAGISFGTWKPNVAAQAVTSTEFVVKDSNEALATDEDRNNLGTENAFSVINHSKVQYHFDVRFEALPDAEGSTERIVAGHINVWSNTVIFHNPETGKDMSFVFDGKATTTVNKVTADNVYTRTVQITCNGDLVDTQVGNVQLTLQ